MPNTGDRILHARSEQLASQRIDEKGTSKFASLAKTAARRWYAVAVPPADLRPQKSAVRMQILSFPLFLAAPLEATLPDLATLLSPIS